MKTRTRNHFDVIIIGGGPAGTAAALSLLKYSKLRIAVLEKTDYTNMRIGETVSPSLIPLLRYLGLESNFLREKHLPSYGIDAAWNTNNLLSRDFIFTFQGNGWHLDRTKFDHMIAKHVIKRGGKLFTNTDILNQKQTKNKKWQIITIDKFEEKHTMNADFVIDASGKNSVFARKIGAKWKVLDTLIGVVSFYQCPQRGPQRMLIESVQNGWWYTSPLPKNKRVIVFMTDTDLAKRLNVIENWKTLVKKTNHIKKTIKGKLISKPKIYPAYSHLIQKIPLNNWLPAGDVASSFDPISAMGIGYAILSGIQAAKSAYEHIQHGYDLSPNYVSNINQNFAQYLKHRHYYYNNEKRWKDSPFWKRRQTKPDLNFHAS